MLLKYLWNPDERRLYGDCFGAMTPAWLDQVDWETRERAESRAASLLPGLFLGRVDGRSPVEYITREADRNHVRRVAGKLLLDPADRLEAVLQAWERELAH
jgi:hypothetical protein